MSQVEKFLASVDLARGQLTNNITHDNSGKIDMQTHGLWAFGTLKDGAHTHTPVKYIYPPAKNAQTLKRANLNFAFF